MSVISPNIAESLNEFAETSVLEFDEDLSKMIQTAVTERLEIEILPKVPLTEMYTDFPRSFLHFSSQEIYEEISAIDFHFIARIQLIECFDQNWNKEKTRHLSPNILEVVSFSANMTVFVAHEILKQETVQNRAEALALFIRVAKDCYDKKNFNGVFSIMSGLLCTPIFRLKQSWGVIRKEKAYKKESQDFSLLEEFAEPNGNYSFYRNYLQSCNPPLIPFLGMYLTDLTFIDQGNTDDIDGMIHYEKYRMMGAIYSDIKRYPKGYEEFKPNRIFYPATIEENELYDLSLRVEPKESAPE